METKEAIDNERKEQPIKKVVESLQRVITDSALETRRS